MMYAVPVTVSEELIATDTAYSPGILYLQTKSLMEVLCMYVAFPSAANPYTEDRYRSSLFIKNRKDLYGTYFIGSYFIGSYFIGSYSDNVVALHGDPEQNYTVPRRREATLAQKSRNKSK